MWCNVFDVCVCILCVFMWVAPWGCNGCQLRCKGERERERPNESERWLNPWGWMFISSFHFIRQSYLSRIRTKQKIPTTLVPTHTHSENSMKLSICISQTIIIKLVNIYQFYFEFVSNNRIADILSTDWPSTVGGPEFESQSIHFYRMWNVPPMCTKCFWLLTHVPLCFMV